MPATLYLVRHGRTMFNEKRVIQGWCDSPLTGEGEEQAARVGRYFAHEGVSTHASDHRGDNRYVVRARTGPARVVLWRL